jgi:YD repeat-containing protein
VLASYNYDAGARLASETDNGTVTNYGYDASNQLTTSGSTTYGWDANGNTKAAGVLIGPNNQLWADGTWSYVYGKIKGDSVHFTSSHAKRIGTAVCLPGFAPVPSCGDKCLSHVHREIMAPLRFQLLLLPPHALLSHVPPKEEHCRSPESEWAEARRPN